MSKVFVSKFINDTRNFVELAPSAPEKPMPDMLRTKALNDGGQPVAADGFFTEVRAQKTRNPGLKHLMLITDGFVLVSKELQDVLKGHDMGSGAFHQTRILNNRGTEVLSDTHCFWNYGNNKKTWSPEDSPRVEPSFNGPDKSQPVSWFPPVDLRDDDIALTPGSLTGPDIWAEWRLRTCLFFSDALVTDLRRAKLDKPFGFKSCRILND